MSNICDLHNKPGSTHYLLVPFCIVNLIDNVSSSTFLGISSKWSTRKDKSYGSINHIFGDPTFKREIDPPILAQLSSH